MSDVRKAAQFLRKCQVIEEAEIAGTECPWELNAGMPPREDFHDTMQAIYIWSVDSNFADNRQYLDRAIRYLKSRRDFLMDEEEPMKSYDAACMILGIHMYLKHVEDAEVSELEDYAIRHLTSYFSGEGPAHNARDYSNPYLKAAMLGYVLRDKNQSLDFLDRWLSRDVSLSKPVLEPAHRGPGFQYPHDFVSTFGSKLFALGVASSSYDFSQAVPMLPPDFVPREHDEVSFNSTILLGLGAAASRTEGTLRDSFLKAASPISRNIEGRIVDGGLKRGNYFPIRESWPTFYFAFATIVLEKGDPFSS